MRRRSLIALLAAAALGGCGLGAGDSPSGTTLTVTQDYGTKRVADLQEPSIRGEDTVMRLLQRNAKVATRFGGGFVQSINGLAGGLRGGRPVDWFYYVNGVEAAKGAASTKLNAGDRIWWDRHDWQAAMRVPAVVGSFPEPFVHGIDGKRLPVRVECVDPRGEPCEQVVRRLTDRDVPAARGGLRTARTDATLRVVIGPWAGLRADAALEQLERGPGVSGVFARPLDGGRRIEVLDERGRATRTLGAGAGLIAATRFEDGPPVWVVTGTDAPGVAAAARAFEEGTLADKFALAVSDDLPVALPEAPER